MAKATPPTGALAHLTEDGRGHSLREHLEGVGGLARQFAAAFDSADWGFLAGLWHDLGKYAADFQSYIRSANGFEAHIESQTIRGRVVGCATAPIPDRQPNTRTCATSSPHTPASSTSSEVDVD